MARQSYPSDLTDAQWAGLERLLPPPKSGTPKGGRPRTVDLREVVIGILYLLRSGCAWRMLAHDLPPWGTSRRGRMTSDSWSSLLRPWQQRLTNEEEPDDDKATGRPGIQVRPRLARPDHKLAHASLHRQDCRHAGRRRREGIAVRSGAGQVIHGRTRRDPGAPCSPYAFGGSATDGPPRGRSSCDTPRPRRRRPLSSADRSAGSG
jgi:transposase